MNFLHNKKALIAVFDSPADREAHMTTFERRLQGLNETEEEFMLILVKLYKAANPKVKAEDLNREVKRKFLHGILGPLSRNLFIFCNNPLDDSASHQDLLQTARDAKVHLSCSATPTSEFGLQQQPGSIDVKQPGDASHTINSIASASPDKTFDAVLALTKKFEEHTNLTEDQFNKHKEEINSLREQPQGRSNWPNYYRGSPRRPFRGRVIPNQGFYPQRFSAPTRSTTPTPQFRNLGNYENKHPEIRCNYCNELNHYKQDCVLFKKDQENSYWHP